MADLKTYYLGLELKNPIILSSGPLTSSIESLIEAEKAGYGAVVLKSIFEEQITLDVDKSLYENVEFVSQSDFDTYFQNVKKDYYIDQYLELLQAAKKNLSIPVIASINCNDSKAWPEYISRFEKLGADAIELNYYPIAADAKTAGDKVDKAALEFAKMARKLTKLPLILKIGYKYSSLANIITGFDKIGIDGIVLFNRFLRPDINIDTLEFTIHSQTSEPTEYAESLRWIGLMSAEVKANLSATTGIHDGETVIKMLLSGASAVQICSAPLLKGLDVVKEMTETLSNWMDKHNYKDILSFKGKLAQENLEDGSAWERTQYMKTLITGKN